MATRAMFRLQSVTISKSGTEEMRSYELCAVTGPAGSEAAQFWRWSPGGTLKLNCVNPKVFDQFEVGKDYYLDFSPVPS